MSAIVIGKYKVQPYSLDPIGFYLLPGPSKCFLVVHYLLNIRREDPVATRAKMQYSQLLSLFFCFVSLIFIILILVAGSKKDVLSSFFFLKVALKSSWDSEMCVTMLTIPRQTRLLSPSLLHFQIQLTSKTFRQSLEMILLGRHSRHRRSAWPKPIRYLFSLPAEMYLARPPVSDSTSIQSQV